MGLSRNIRWDALRSIAVLKVRVRLHAILRDLVPGGRAEIELSDHPTIKDLLDHLGVDPELRELITINREQISDVEGHLLSEGDEIEVFPAVMGGSRDAYLSEGLRLFDEADYFLSHETLEEYWVEAPTDERDFFQGLINLAVGLHHYQKGNLRGMELQFGKAASRLDAYPGEYLGVDLVAVRKFLVEVPKILLDGSEMSPPRLSRSKTS